MARQRPVAFKNILRPDVNKLTQCGTLLIDTKGMADFLGIAPQKVNQLLWTDRLPMPIRLPLADVLRWSVFELLEWVENGCPRREAWMKMRGWSGSFHLQNGYIRYISN